MGWKYEVSAWVESKDSFRGYEYKSIYYGDIFLAAAFHAIKARYTYSCIRIFWR